MVRTRGDRETPICPLIDLDDRRCDTRFTLRHLNEALDLCAGQFQGCPTYVQILREQMDHVASRVSPFAHDAPNIDLTLNGQPVYGRRLRATGS
mgnify:CR=1 FL=1